MPKPPVSEPANAATPAHKLRRVVKKTVERAAELALARVGDDVPDVPGAPGVEPPALAEPTKPRGPLPPKPDQAGPAGQDVGPQGSFLTTGHGVRLRDTDHSLKAGRRGPTLLQDQHLREKVSHFDHERIPERAVHARGAGAHGVFVGYGNADTITTAALLGRHVETPVFVRFSTVLGSRGSADTVRDTRGFAVKFYTPQGTWDLVGNNMPVFFIQDGIKFPDVVHAAKPHPDREIPQAQSAHDTFWDFVSLHTEAQHHTLWNMSDRGIPRSYRTMEGFGVHTFRLVNAAGETSLVKFHWKPKLGVHSLVWEEAQMLAGNDPDFHRRDLADAIESGAHPQWELGVQVFADTPEETFEGIDLLDPTKLVPEELAPVQPIGLLTLTHNPTNYFAETEQVAYSVGNLVPGIDVTNDSLLQARLFSYVDTQLTRLGGPNWNQLPINRAQAPVNDMLRDGMHQTIVHGGVAPYRPHSLDAGCPFLAGGARDGGFVDVPVVVPEGTKVREHSASFEDHYSQARLFWLSMTALERQHIIASYTFELAKVVEQTIKERQLQALANIDPELCAEVAAGLGLKAPSPTIDLVDAEPSAALTQVGGTWPLDGRVVGVLVDADGDLTGVDAAVEALRDAGTLPLVVAARGGKLANGLTVHRVLTATRSVEYDAVVLAGCPAPAPDALPARDAKAGQTDEATDQLDPRVALLVDECWRHGKAVGAFGRGAVALGLRDLDGDDAGVVVGDDPATVVAGITGLLGAHRVWERFPAG